MEDIMKNRWGRTDTAGTFPRPKPVWSTTVLIVAILGGMATETYWYARVWTPLQQHYLSTYLHTACLSALGLSSGHYELLEVVHTHDQRLALDDEVEPDPAAETGFALTEAGRRAGDRQLVWRGDTYQRGPLYQFLREYIYQKQGLTDLTRPAIWATILVFGVGLLLAVPRDVIRAHARRLGRRLKGPELVTIRQFNRRTRADGVGFVQAPTIASWITRCRTWLRIPRDIESSHLLIMGDSGTGKSALIRQIPCQLAARGETAIVYDPALEYTAQFYEAQRGDVILNPLDARCPYWSPGDEVQRDVEALTIAASLFPDRRNENPFFTEGPRRMFAHLLTFKPRAEELASWLCDERELDQRVQGTAYAAMIDPKAPAQRSGVLASLNMVADTLKLLPAASNTTARWTAATWARERKGWLFLTSTPESRTRLIPLTSLWLDLLVLRLMNLHQPHRQSVWFILDELATLQRLPQLHTAITENRKSKNPVVLGFQGRSQLETRYGHDAEAMLSQPATKIFLRTSEPNAAAWISATIGEVETERLTESRSHGQQSHRLERQVEPLVMPSEISGLAALHGYLKLGNLVTRLHVPFIELPDQASAFVDRQDPPSAARLPAVSDSGPSTDSAGQRVAQEPRIDRHQGGHAATQEHRRMFD
jgi:hypothetical protein